MRARRGAVTRGGGTLGCRLREGVGSKQKRKNLSVHQRGHSALFSFSLGIGRSK